MTWKRPPARTFVIALFVAAMAPILWFAIFAETWKTPPITRDEAEKMASAQTDTWIRENSRRASLFEHMKDAPGFVSRHWLECLSATGAVFALMVVVSGFQTRKKGE